MVSKPGNRIDGTQTAVMELRRERESTVVTGNDPKNYLEELSKSLQKVSDYDEEKDMEKYIKTFKDKIYSNTDGIVFEWWEFWWSETGKD